MRVGDIVQLVNGYPFDSSDFASDGEVPLVRIRDLLQGGRFATFVPRAVVPSSAVVNDGDVIIGMDGDFNCQIWSRGRAALNQRLCVLTGPRDSDLRFVAYALPRRLREINELTYATTVKHLSSGQVRSVRIAAPSLGEQRAVADYLDRETARIDELIVKQERLIETLRERRVSLVFATFAGVNAKSMRLKYLFRLRDRRNQPNEPVMSVYRDYGVVVKSTRDDNFNRTPESLDRYLLANPGDVVINRMKAWQGSLGVAKQRGIVSGDYEVLSPIGEFLLPSYSHWLLRSPGLIAEYGRRSTGIRPSQWRIYWEQTGQISVPVPPVEEQREIVARLDEQTAKIDALVGRAERFIELSRERRSALITAAVTGQIDVGAAT